MSDTESLITRYHEAKEEYMAIKKRIRELATQITLVEEDTTRTQKRLDRANYKASNSESSTTPTKWVTSSDSILSEIPLGNTQGGVITISRHLRFDRIDYTDLRVLHSPQK
eukprot:TRINITY_DN705_c0_g2_i8.p1 TRINITY_DN705_c0_g2~~TRINITY_DN705_c0_g2_i8.p1  ORF type:complete len:111 (-),score=21.22 TRINITY_DN705_c0_g2_i8:879-1211(-)